MAGDEWYGIEIGGQGWRLGKLEELAMYAPQGTTSITALVARDRQLLRLTLPLPQASAPLSNYKLRVQDEAAVNRWLSA
jgi:hypothetical protein